MEWKCLSTNPTGRNLKKVQYTAFSQQACFSERVVEICKEVFHAILVNWRSKNEVLNTTFDFLKRSLNAVPINLIGSEEALLEDSADMFCSQASVFFKCDTFDVKWQFWSFKTRFYAKENKTKQNKQNFYSKHASMSAGWFTQIVQSLNQRFM